MPLIHRPGDPPNVGRMGGKAAALAELSAAGLPIPPWFVISPEAFERSRAAHAGDVASLIPADDVAMEIDRALDELFEPDQHVAVRSSAVDEDSSGHSFAGQFESYLFVPRRDVPRRVADVWRSGYADRVIAYRREHGLDAAPAAPAVLVQRMIPADVSGVAFAADPITGSRSTILVSAVFGLGTALVGGDADADTYRLDRAGNLLEQHIADKSFRHVADPTAPQGFREEPLAETQRSAATLDRDMLRAIAELALNVSRLRRRPQDIEWAVHEGTLYLLQARPITSLASLPDPDGIRVIWDNSNIAESYNGITTPLTFTFARRAYDGVYREFCRMMKVPRRVIADNDAMFGQMLGLIRGRVYYNLLNWYRLLAMLPGFSVNQRFMEQMMGVREGLDPEIAQAVAARTWSQRNADRLRLAWSAAGLIWHHFTLRRSIRAFYGRLNDVLAPPHPPLEEMRLDELTAEFRKLEARLLSRWDAPLVNDFLAMIFFGLLGKLSSRWCAGAGPNVQNDLLSDEGGMISTEPARRIATMAQLAARDSHLTELLCEADAPHCIRRLETAPQLHTAYRAYLDKFGDRCLEELKLESTTLIDDPTPLLRCIGQAARRILANPSEPPAPYRPREAAERAVADALKRHPFRRILFARVLRNARHRVRDRENLRFERTRLFGRVRRIFLEAGRRLVAEGMLDDQRDIFYLTLDEILSFVEGTAVGEDLRGIANLRKAQFDRYRTLPAPADRFETRGAAYLGNRFQADGQTSSLAPSAGQLQGTGCCPGIVRGPVRVIRDPRGAHLRHGEILVAERTDPGWIMLFPAAAGVLVERGSLLSHSAIVARELGIPAVVAIANLTSTLSDGQIVEMDGSAGTVRIIEPPPASEAAQPAAVEAAR